MVLRSALLLVASCLLCVPLASSQRLHRTCTTAPRSHWMSWAEIESRLGQQSLRLVRLRIAADRCLGVIARDDRGVLVELLLDPVSGDPVMAYGVDANPVGSIPHQKP